MGIINLKVIFEILFLNKDIYVTLEVIDLKLVVQVHNVPPPPPEGSMSQNFDIGLSYFFKHNFIDFIK